MHQAHDPMARCWRCMAIRRLSLPTESGQKRRQNLLRFLENIVSISSHKTGTEKKDRTQYPMRFDDLRAQVTSVTTRLNVA
jgi:hypothetical protein